jgi:hypothetical protein
MSDDDRVVLEFLGGTGKSSAEILERFPDFDVRRLIRAGLVEEQRFELAETQAHALVSTAQYVLTVRGASAVGIDPIRLRRT